MTEMNVEAKTLPECKVELVVRVGADVVAEGKKAAVKTVGKEVEIAGFRKGKAPVEMILKKYPQEVEKQIDKAIADLTFNKAKDQAGIAVLNGNSRVTFDMKKRDNEGAELVFSYETEPQIPVVDREKFAAKEVEKKTVGEKEVEEALKQMRFFYANWTDVTDRDIRDGDYITLDLSTVENGEVTKVFDKIRFEVSEARMANWMRKLVKGARAGQTLEGVSEADEGETEEFKPKNVIIHIVSVEEAALPELDEEFAKKAGAKDIAHLKESIETMLKRQVTDKAEKDLREQVNEFLSKEYTFELPKSLVIEEARHRFKQMAEDPQFKARWEKKTDEEKDAFVKKMEEESAEAVRLFYLSRSIVKGNNIPVTHQEVHNVAAETARGMGQNPDETAQGLYALALSKVILGKAQDFILMAKTA